MWQREKYQTGYVGIHPDEWESKRIFGSGVWTKCMLDSTLSDGSVAEGQREEEEGE